MQSYLRLILKSIYQCHVYVPSISWLKMNPQDILQNSDSTLYSASNLKSGFF